MPLGPTPPKGRSSCATCIKVLFMPTLPEVVCASSQAQPPSSAPK